MEVSEFYEGAKHLKWSSDFMSKTEVEYNTAYLICQNYAILITICKQVLCSERNTQMKTLVLLYK